MSCRNCLRGTLWASNLLLLLLGLGMLGYFGYMVSELASGKCTDDFAAPAPAPAPAPTSGPAEAEEESLMYSEDTVAAGRHLLSDSFHQKVSATAPTHTHTILTSSHRHVAVVVAAAVDTPAAAAISRAVGLAGVRATFRCVWSGSCVDHCTRDAGHRMLQSLPAQHIPLSATSHDAGADCDGGSYCGQEEPLRTTERPVREVRQATRLHMLAASVWQYTPRCNCWRSDICSERQLMRAAADASIIG